MQAPGSTAGHLASHEVIACVEAAPRWTSTWVDQAGVESAASWAADGQLGNTTAVSSIKNRTIDLNIKVGPADAAVIYVPAASIVSLYFSNGELALHFLGDELDPLAYGGLL